MSGTSENFGNVVVIDTVTGIVKYFKATYGFITPDDSRLDDIFIHCSNIEPWRKGFKLLKEGQKVKFGYRKKELKNGKEGLEAVNLEILREKIDESRFKMNKGRK